MSLVQIDYRPEGAGELPGGQHYSRVTEVTVTGVSVGNLVLDSTILYPDGFEARAAVVDEMASDGADVGPEGSSARPIIDAFRMPVLWERVTRDEPSDQDVADAARAVETSIAESRRWAPLADAYVTHLTRPAG